MVLEAASVGLKTGTQTVQYDLSRLTLETMPLKLDLAVTPTIVPTTARVAELPRLEEGKAFAPPGEGPSLRGDPKRLVVLHPATEAPHSCQTRSEQSALLPASASTVGKLATLAGTAPLRKQFGQPEGNPGYHFI